MEGLHPGGNASITMNAGTDATEDFEAVHSAKAWGQLEQYVIGYLHPKDNPAAAKAAAAGGGPGGAGAGAEAGTSVALVKMAQRAPEAKGPVNLLKYALEHPEMYGETLVGEAAEAAAFDRMWAGAQNDVKPGDLDAAPMVG